ncbi:MAG: hypothetical protein AAFU73_23120 [Planctomycetota bacterium]
MDSDDKEAEPAWREFLPTRRFTTLVHRALNEGVGAFLLTLALFTVAASLGRWAFTSRSVENERMENELENFLAEVEPRRQEPLSGVETATLASINGDKDAWEQRVAAQPASIALGSAAELLGDLIALQRAERAVQDNRSEWIKARLREIGMMPTDEVASEISRILDDWEARNPLDLTPIGFTEEQRHHTSTSTSALTEMDGASTVSTLYVPSALEGINSPRWTGSSRKPQPYEGFRTRAAEAVHISRLFDQILRLQSTADHREDQLAVAQRYFISPTGVMRVTPELRRTDLARHFSPNEHLDSARYVQTFMDGEKRAFTTGAYLDYVSNGVVMTRSFPIRTNTRLGAEDEDEIVTTFHGVLAVDFVIPPEDLVRRLAEETALFSIEGVLIEVSEEGQASITHSRRIERSIVESESSLASWITAGSESGRCARLDAALGTATAKTDRPATRQITAFHMDGSNYQSYLVPLSRDRHQSGHFLGVVLTPVTPGQGWAFVLKIAGAAAALFVGITSFLIGNRHLRRANEINRRLNIMNSLGVGVVLLDQDDTLIEGNSRAEKLLGVELRRPGAVRRHLPALPRTEASILLDDLIIPCFDSDASEQDDANLKEPRRYADLIPSLRGMGEPSSYFARVRHSGNWLKVNGSPLVATSRSRRPKRASGIHLEGTLGVIQLVEDDRLRKSLDEMTESSPYATKMAREGAVH